MPLLTPLTDDEVRALAAAFGLPPLTAITPILDGVTNTNYSIDAGGAGYILRVCNAGDAVAQKILRLTGWLRAQGFPTPACLTPPAPVRHLNLPVMVFERIDGRMPGFEAVDLHDAGALLRQLHGLPAPEWLTDELELGVTLLREVMPKITDAAFKADLQWAEQKIQTMSGDARALSHADLYADNFLRDSAGGLHLLDWDVACRFAPAFDWGVAAVGLCRPDAPAFRDRLRAFLGGYRGAGSTPTESETIEAAAVAALCWSAWRFRQFEMRATNQGRLGTYKFLWESANKLRSGAV